jgi:hypothetical protein
MKNLKHIKLFESWIEKFNTKIIKESQSSNKIELFDGGDRRSTIIMPKLETSQDFFNKLFYEYFKDSVIIVGYSGSTKWTLIAEKDGDDYSTEVGFEEDEDGKGTINTYSLSIRLKDYAGMSPDRITKSGFFKKYEFIYNGQNIKDFIQDDMYSEVGFDSIKIPLSSGSNFSTEGEKAANKFGEYFKKWICDKLHKNSSNWDLYTIQGGNERFPNLANAMLGQGYTRSDDISGTIFGRFGDVITN